MGISFGFVTNFRYPCLSPEYRPVMYIMTYNTCISVSRLATESSLNYQQYRKTVAGFSEHIQDATHMCIYIYGCAHVLKALKKPLALI